MLRLLLGTNDSNVRIILQNIINTPTISATFAYQKISVTEGLSEHTLDISGQQYTSWTNDNTIIYNIICNNHSLEYVPHVEPQYYNEVLVYKNEQGQTMTNMIQTANPSYVSI
jgi:hypothetical protein